MILGGVVNCTSAYRDPPLSRRKRRFLLFGPLLGVAGGRTMLCRQKQLYAYRQARRALGYWSGLQVGGPLPQDLARWKMKRSYWRVSHKLLRCISLHRREWVGMRGR